MNTWTPLWSGIVESSLWEEDGDVVKVFMTLLARKDSDDICRLNAFNIHKLCNIDEVKVLEILKILTSPDARRVERQEFGGRRIKAVEDGWFILNGQKYRDMVEKERRQARWRRAQAAARSRAKKSGQTFNHPTTRKAGTITEGELAAHAEVQRSVQNLNEIQSAANQP
jgi:hypothetical protein